MKVELYKRDASMYDETWDFLAEFTHGTSLTKDEIAHRLWLEGYPPEGSYMAIVGDEIYYLGLPADCD